MKKKKKDTLKDFYKAKRPTEVVHTAVLAISCICNVNMYISSLSDMLVLFVGYNLQSSQISV